MTKQSYQADWIDYMDAYRVYDPEHPQQTVAYVDEEELQIDKRLVNCIIKEQNNG